MKSSKSNWVFVVLIAVAAIAWGIYRFQPAPPPPPPVAITAPVDQETNVGMPSDRSTFVPPDDPALMNQVFDLDSRLKELDATVWRGEMLSHRYGDVFVKLWDSLRHSTDPFRTLIEFPVGEITLGDGRTTSEHEHGIMVTKTGEPTRPLDAAGWRQQLTTWREAGYRLDASEWRHPIFDPPADDSPARSTIQVTLLVEHPAKQERITIRGDLRVLWSEPADPAAAPLPAQIDASRLELTARTGAPMFEPLVSKVVMPFTNTDFIGPLMAYDLDGDGLAEIILGCRNQVYWNRGGGNFEVGTLCRYRPEDAYTTTLGDFNGDGHVDLLVADQVGVELYVGNARGQFNEPGRRVWTAPEPLKNPFVFGSGDVDGDGDLDVWLAQYQIPYMAGQMPTPYYDANDGFPSYLLLNDGRGNFTDATQASGLGGKRNRRAYSASFIDLDEDGDLDFIQVSDFAGLDVFLNDGKGRFTDVTATHVDEPHSLGMGHTFGDYDLDGRMDFYVIGMTSYAAQRMDHLGEGPAEFPLYQKMRPIATYGNRMYFARDGQWVHTPMSDQVARTGWSWGAATADFDNDQDPDLIVNNSQITRRTAKDYETQFWRHDIYIATSELDPVRHVYFNMTQDRLFGEGWSYGGHEFNHFYLNEGGKSFLLAAYQVGLALRLDLRGVLADDFDGDGRMDLAFDGFEPWPAMQSSFHLYKNNWQNAGNWIGFRLREEGGGFTPIGARVNLTLNDGRVLKRVLVTGDSFRSQSAPVAHFGLGADSSVKQVEIIWSNGTVKRIAAPPINQYHAVRGR
jgi:enediyne biosynthesis protein E4